MVTLRCAVLRSNPPRLTDIRWYRNGELIRMPMPDLKETPELKFKLEPTNNGSYECRVSNSAGTSTCTFNVSGEKKINEIYRTLESNTFSFSRPSLLSSSFQVSFIRSLCSLYTTAKPYNAEFYFDTPNPVRILKGNNYSYNLQWTQKEPKATDLIIGYWVNIRKVKYTHSHTHKPV